MRLYVSGQLWVVHDIVLDKMNSIQKLFNVVLFTAVLLLTGRVVFYRPPTEKDKMSKNVTVNASTRSEDALSLREAFHLMQVAPFEMSNDQCAVRILANSTDYQRAMAVRGDATACTSRRFDDYFRATGQFYGEGIWDDSRPGYLPASCQFSRRLDTSGELEACLVRKNITKILITGDSTGRLLANQLVKFVQNQTDVSCVLKKHTGGINRTLAGHKVEKELQYFVVPRLPSNALISEPCGFAFTGYSFQHECIFHRTNRVLQLEYISSVRAVDTTLHINRSAVRSNQPMRAENKMEYLLTYYFPHYGFPDLWVYSPYFRHECWSTSVLQLMADLSYLFNLLEIHAPSSVDLLFLGDTRICETKVPANVLSAFENKYKLSLNEQIHRFSQIMYHVLRPFHSRMQNWHAFIDGMKVTCPLTCKFHQDGGHLNDKWFLDLGRNILDVFCIE